MVTRLGLSAPVRGKIQLQVRLTLGHVHVMLIRLAKVGQGGGVVHPTVPACSIRIGWALALDGAIVRCERA